MSDWSKGYVHDVEYLNVYFRIQAPACLADVALINGYDSPLFDGEFTYCDVGCGGGFTAAVTAAANPASRVFGIDVNPTHIAHARKLAAAGGIDNATFLEASVEEFGPGDLPPFDVVAINGVYSWVAPEVRAAIVAFLKSFVKPGGIVLVTYNAMPGWGDAMGIQHVVREFGLLSKDRSDNQAISGLDYVGRLAEAGAAFIDKLSLDTFKEQIEMGKTAYLAHELMNANWEPATFMEVARHMSEARLSYVGTAIIPDNFDSVSLSPEQRELLAEAKTPELQETVRDLFLRRRFRRDVYMRGPVRIGKREWLPRVLDSELVLVRARDAIPLEVEMTQGKAGLDAEIFAPLLDRLLSGPARVGDLLEDCRRRGSPEPSAIEVFAMLLATSGVARRLRPADLPARKFNMAVTYMPEAQAQRHSLAFAAPAVGIGAWMTPLEVALYRVMATVGPDADARDVANRLVETGKAMDLPIATDETTSEAPEALVTAIGKFLQYGAPQWRDLGIL